MSSTVTIDLRHVARGLGMGSRQVQAVVELLDEGNTVPFITRYRKDQTGGLDEDQIRQIQSRLEKMRLLADRKQTILRSIEAQGKLTEKLAKQIHSASTGKRLEDLYLPYKPKKQTLATLARSRGLESFAREILDADPACADLDARAADFVNPEREVPTPADALLGAGHILAEQYSERAELRHRLREILQRTGKIVSVQIGGETKGRTEPAVAREKAGETNGVSAGVTREPSQGPPPQEEHEQAAEASATPEGAPGPVTETAGQDPGGIGTQGQQDEPTGPAPPPPGEQPAEPAAEPPGGPPDGQPVPVQTEPPSESQIDQGAVESQLEQAVAEPQVKQPPPTEGEPGPPATEDQAPPEAPPPEDAEGQPSAPSEAAASASSEAAQPAPSPAQSRPTAGPREPKLPRLSKKELKKKKAEEKRVKAFRDYFDYQEELKKIPPHRVLAINRGERAKVLRVKIESDVEAMHRALDELLVSPEHPHGEYLRGCARDALARLILPSLEREMRRELTDRAEAHAVGVFARNLRNLLLQPPIQDRRVLAVDPGFKSGCKLAALDQFGNLLEHGVIFLIGPPQRRDEARQKVLDLVNRYQLSVVAIGNGTACRQSEEFFAELIATDLKDHGVAYVIVNEAGASVYSISRIGREEFPDYDATLRGAISIGRRLQDPLSELVKIDAASIGVGLYQHDVKAKHLRSSLDEVVESCVNYVGVDVNTASSALLRYVSGLNQLTARRVYEHRQEHGPLRGREQLRDIPGFGEATFVQAAGFLKIANGDNPLDATWIHPESYGVAGRVLNGLGCSTADLTEAQSAAAVAERIAGVDLEETAKTLGVGTLTLKDILAQLVRPGRDPREDLPAPVFKHGVLKLEDLSAGMELTGTVLNVVDFGAFVDIGMHDSGLVHVSQLADRFVRDPHEVVAVGDVVRVWVNEVDKQRRRVSLTMIEPGTQRARGRRRGKKGESGEGAGAEGRDQKAEGSGRRAEGRGQRAGGGRKPRPDQGAKGKGHGRPGRPPGGKGPPRPRYRPKSRPKPVVPITDAMKAGKEPMRTFGDLAQFFQHQEHQHDDGGQEKRPEVRSETAATPEKTPAGEPPAVTAGHDTPEPGADAPTGHDPTEDIQSDVPVENQAPTSDGDAPSQRQEDVAADVPGVEDTAEGTPQRDEPAT